MPDETPIKWAAMKAAYIDSPGPPEAIHFGDLPTPAVTPAKILVRVTAVCVDPIDVYIRSGAFKIPLPSPFIIGRDLVGRVEEVGPGVTKFKVGDRVWCNNQGYDDRQGTFAEYALVEERLLYPLPAGVDEQQAVAFVHSAFTACLGLERVRPRAGETIFVNGGAGNVGSAVIQMAKGRGLRVAATAGSAEGLDWCHSIGAGAVANYKTDDVDSILKRFAPDGVNIYWDTSGQPDFDAALNRLSTGGRIIVMAGLKARPPFPVGPFYVKGCSMHGFAITHATDDELAMSAKAIVDWMSQGKLKVRIDRVLPLSETQTAHRLVEERAPLAGKIVLTP
jgi:NADPH2:quinone reductase